MQWEAVSRELAAAMAAAGDSSGMRPALACLQRFQQLAAAAAKAGSFDMEEGLAHLAALVAKHGSSWKVGLGGWGWLGGAAGLEVLLEWRARRCPCLPACLPSSLKACLPACLPSILKACLPAPLLPFPCPHSPLHPSTHRHTLQRIAEEFGGGWDADQLMHIWRRHAQRGPAARKGKWSQEEDDALLKVGWVGGWVGRRLRVGGVCAGSAWEVVGGCQEQPAMLSLMPSPSGLTSLSQADSNFRPCALPNRRPWRCTGASGARWPSWWRGAPTCSAGSGTWAC